MRKNINPEATLLAFVTAGHKARTVTFGYVKEGTTKEELRTVEVHHVEATEDGFFTVVGWDRVRQDRRTFRLDRVTAFTVHRVKRTAAHLAWLSEKETEELLALLAEPVREPVTSREYNEHGDWLAGEADRAERKGDEGRAAELWELADLAWELARS